MCCNVTIQVSSKRWTLHVEVMEPVRGLSILGSSAAIPVGVKRLFVAQILTGKPVHFLWTFDLHHLQKTPHIGEEVRSFKYLTFIIYDISQYSKD